MAKTGKLMTWKRWRETWGFTLAILMIPTGVFAFIFLPVVFLCSGSQNSC